MKKQALNPYLPIDTYIPDGEPHVFGKRVYIFGSHDKEDGEQYCMLDYEVWSAPVDDPGNWTCHGISYRSSQDPACDEQHRYMYAPDVVQGNDGKYYLYYALAYPKFTSPIHAAVSEKPEGPYEYYGVVKTEDGKIFERNVTFDPGLINDNGTIRMYYGWAMASPQIAGISKEQREQMRPMLQMAERKLLDKTEEQIECEKEGIQGAFVVTIADDMLTVLSEPKKILPGQFDAAGTEFQGHAFFEASSIRKIGSKYYFIYSSEVNHELCYAVSDMPDENFHYKGVIISNGDIGLNGRKAEDRVAATGNNHGSIECINGQWYVFYHRHTHKSSYSRQGCAEKIEISESGEIKQVEMTSCGLNGRPLKAEWVYPAVIACNLTNGHMPHMGADKTDADIPYITSQGEERYITNIRQETRIVYKYFNLSGRTQIKVKYRLCGEGSFLIQTDTGETGKILLREENGNDWNTAETSVAGNGKTALTFIFEGTGNADLLELEF